ncbi:hypothetical protein GJ654_15595 [Rhodoblastus acidophilus]|uniref:Uncharacterized protein n=1 Tax=Rhodoblastus acidophilus TaxID=1074 RepID=A0A6N8DP89_RHOAC|nr:hypothetical protein [Rhodoblastus acidophilus]MTV32412.1 hypothetical protein [Rhodoblastus acidophilus]
MHCADRLIGAPLVERSGDPVKSLDQDLNMLVNLDKDVAGAQETLFDRSASLFELVMDGQKKGRVKRGLALGHGGFHRKSEYAAYRGAIST